MEAATHPERGTGRLDDVLFDIRRHPVKPPRGLGLDLGELGRAFHLGPGEEVELDLRLGPRRPGGEPDARGVGVEDEQVARGLGQGAAGLPGRPGRGSRGSGSRRPRSRLSPPIVRGGSVRKAAISVWILLDPLAALVRLVDQPLAVVADVDVEVVEVFQDGLLAVLDRGRQLGEEERGDGGVLVADVRPLQVAVRLLEAEQEPGGPPRRSAGRST